MDKNSARGRACSIAASILNGVVQTGNLIDEASVATSLTSEELSMIKQELQAIAQEHGEHAKFHKAIESGKFLDNRGVNKAGDEVRLWTGSKEDVERRYSVTLYSLGYAIDFEVSALDEAKKLFDVLMCVQEVEAD